MSSNLSCFRRETLFDKIKRYFDSFCEVPIDISEFRQTCIDNNFHKHKEDQSDSISVTTTFFDVLNNYLITKDWEIAKQELTDYLNCREPNLTVITNIILTLCDDKLNLLYTKFLVDYNDSKKISKMNALLCELNTKFDERLNKFKKLFNNLSVYQKASLLKDTKCVLRKYTLLDQKSEVSVSLTEDNNFQENDNSFTLVPPLAKSLLNSPGDTNRFNLENNDDSRLLKSTKNSKRARSNTEPSAKENINDNIPSISKRSKEIKNLEDEIVCYTDNTTIPGGNITNDDNRREETTSEEENENAFITPKATESSKKRVRQMRSSNIYRKKQIIVDSEEESEEIKSPDDGLRRKIPGGNITNDDNRREETTSEEENENAFIAPKAMESSKKRVRQMRSSNIHCKKRIMVDSKEESEEVKSSDDGLQRKSPRLSSHPPGYFKRKIRPICLLYQSF